MSEWQTMDAAPMDGTAILGFWTAVTGAFTRITGANYGIAAYCSETGEWYDASEDNNEDDLWVVPDYWMPLPGPPTD